MSKEQLNSTGTWIYRIIIGAIVISMWTKVDRAVDLTLVHENEIKNLKEMHTEIKSNYRELITEVAKIRESQYQIKASIQQSYTQ